MTLLADAVLDPALQKLTDDVNSLHICNAEPTTYAEATSTFTIGNKATPPVSAPQAGSPDGRQVTVSAITDGSATATDTATHYALVDTVGSVLLATAALSASKAVNSGDTFELAAFTVRIPAAA